MLPIELLKELERRGFELNYPDTIPLEGKIVSIMKENNPRYFLALPLLLMEEFDYKSIMQKLDNEKSKIGFNRIICISSIILQDEGISRGHLKKIIDDSQLSLQDDPLSWQELETYRSALREALLRQKEQGTKEKEAGIRQRSQLNLNTALSTIFSPAKIRIMEKIFQHEKLSNTELKYYYKSIKPRGEAILNESLQNYLRIISSIKKHH